MSDILIGLIPALCWGMQGIVMQKIGGRTANKQLGMVLTALVFAVAVFIVSPPSKDAWTSALILAALLNGIPWAVGQILQIRAFELIGVARAIPISTGMQLFGTTLVGVVFFKEWVQGWQFWLGIPALLLLVLGAWLTTYREAGDELLTAATIRVGLIVLTISSVAYVLYATAGTMFQVEPLDLLLPQAVVMVVATIVISLLTAKKGEVRDRTIGVFGSKTWKNMLTGILFAVGNFAVDRKSVV